ncbi:MAG TPA: dihydroneopterin aldolase [Steroidobacteraceae bacterium]|nr:dihydroneopterin aldolase [Steroidobacteraceae bacterium]
MDKIFLTALSTEAVIGIFDWEREIRQRIEIDLEMSVDLAAATKRDSIEDTLNYKSVAKQVLALVEASRFRLVETLAEHVACLVLTEFPVERVRVTVHKPGAIRHSRDVGVIIERGRQDAGAADG